MEVGYALPRRPGPSATKWLGLFAAFAGGAIAALYPLYSLGALPGADVWSVEFVPEPVDPRVVYCSTALAPLLLVWGAFTARDRTSTPLTVRRALLVPLASLPIHVLGVGAFVLEWRRTPHPDPPEHVLLSIGDDPTLVEMVRWELNGVNAIALAAATAAVVGTVTARRGKLAGLATAAVPAALAGIAIADWGLHDWPATEIFPFVALLSAIPFATGYLAAQPD